MSFKLTPKSNKHRAVPLAAFQDDGDEDLQADLAAAAEAAERLKVKGMGLAEQAEWGPALNCWERALQLLPNLGQVHELRAQALNELGRTWEAVQAATRACELMPESADAHVTLGRAQLNLGEPALALKSMEAALLLQPGHEEAKSEMPEVRMLALQQHPGTRAQVGGKQQQAAACGSKRSRQLGSEPDPSEPEPSSAPLQAPPPAAAAGPAEEGGKCSKCS